MSFKKTIASLVGKTPLWRVGEILRRMPRILSYHGVIQENYHDIRVQANQILFRDFEQHIVFLRKHYVFISLDEFFERFSNNQPFSGKEILLVFDDGYRNNLTVVAPYLDSLHIPFAVFIATGLVDTNDFIPTYYIRSAILADELKSIDLSTLKEKYSLTAENRMYVMNRLINCIKEIGDSAVSNVIAEIEAQLGRAARECINSSFESERIMNWNDVKQLFNMGATIGSHSVHHTILHSKQTEEIIDNQLKQSKQAIVDHVGHCRYFAYPNGANSSVCKAARRMAQQYYDMSFAITGTAVKQSDPFNFISRISVAFELDLLKLQISLLS